MGVLVYVRLDPLQGLFLFQAYIALKVRGSALSDFSSKHEVLAIFLFRKKRAYGLLGRWVVQSEHPVPGPTLQFTQLLWGSAYNRVGGT